MIDDNSFSEVAMANALYEIEKQKAQTIGMCDRITVRIIESRVRLKPGQLKHWRSNNLSRAGMLVRNGHNCGSLP